MAVLLQKQQGLPRTVKKTVSKAQIRAQLDAEVERYLNGGGEVENVPRGISGKDPGDPPVFLNKTLFVEPKTDRTLVPEVVAAIEARRQNKTKRPAGNKPKPPRKPRRKVIYDDFGEPLREVWVED